MRTACSMMIVLLCSRTPTATTSAGATVRVASQVQESRTEIGVLTATGSCRMTGNGDDYFEDAVSQLRNKAASAGGNTIRLVSDSGLRFGNVRTITAVSYVVALCFTRVSTVAMQPPPRTAANSGDGVRRKRPAMAEALQGRAKRPSRHSRRRPSKKSATTREASNVKDGRRRLGAELYAMPVWLATR